jgi:hypothetical protein
MNGINFLHCHSSAFLTYRVSHLGIASFFSLSELQLFLSTSVAFCQKANEFTHLSDKFLDPPGPQSKKDWRMSQA